MVEKASIDEAFVLVAPTAQPHTGSAIAPAADVLQQGQGGHTDCDLSWDLLPGVRLGADVRAAALSELGLKVSVGVATNKVGRHGPLQGCLELCQDVGCVW